MADGSPGPDGKKRSGIDRGRPAERAMAIGKVSPGDRPVPSPDRPIVKRRQKVLATSPFKCDNIVSLDSEVMDSNELIILAGKGQYPRLLAEGARTAGVKRLAVLAVRGQTERALVREADLSATYGIGETGKMRDWLRSTGIHQIVMAGQITPTALFTTRFDSYARSLMKDLKAKTAHSIYGMVSSVLESIDLHVLPASTYMDAYLPSPGVLTEREPDERERVDIELGHKAAMAIGTVDVGQTIVIKDGMVLAVEAFEGTNAAIRRGAKLGGKGAVVVKVARAGHDMRFDIPVIGAQTMRVLRRAGVSAIAFQAKRTIFLDRDNVIFEANRLGMSIVALETSLPPAPTRPPAGSAT